MYDSDMKKRLTATIVGRVQLVMYRDFSQRKARKLGLVGTVRNMKDGSVSIMAEGDEAILNQYVTYLKRGPILSRVDAVHTVWGEATGTFGDFLIVY